MFSNSSNLDTHPAFQNEPAELVTNAWPMTAITLRWSRLHADQRQANFFQVPRGLEFEHYEARSPTPFIEPYSVAVAYCLSTLDHDPGVLHHAHTMGATSMAYPTAFISVRIRSPIEAMSSLSAPGTPYSRALGKRLAIVSAT